MRALSTLAAAGLAGVAAGVVAGASLAGLPVEPRAQAAARVASVRTDGTMRDAMRGAGMSSPGVWLAGAAGNQSTGGNLRGGAGHAIRPTLLAH